MLKNQKSEKTWICQKPTPSSFFWKHVQQQQKTVQKTQTKFQKKKSELGLDPATHFRVFLGFLDFSP